MAKLAERLLPTVYKGRAIAGKLGFRPHDVALLSERWSGSHTGDGSAYPDSTPITEADGQSPKVRWLKDDEVALGNIGAGAIEVGPITPAFPGGGTELDLLAASLDRGATRYLVITGPKHPVGARYRIARIEAGRTLRYVLRAEPVRPGE
jgi:hypothetical protein